jgi:hypothetical protein
MISSFGARILPGTALKPSSYVSKGLTNPSRIWNAILGLESNGGKWLGILSATAYDRHTIYLLVNLERVLDDADDNVVFLGGVRGGWRRTFPSVDFIINFCDETVIYEDGRRKSFDDCFDKSVDEREAREKLTRSFNENRTTETLLNLFLGKWRGEVVWTEGAVEGSPSGPAGAGRQLPFR